MKGTLQTILGWCEMSFGGICKESLDEGLQGNPSKMDTKNTLFNLFKKKKKIYTMFVAKFINKHILIQECYAIMYACLYVFI